MAFAHEFSWSVSRLGQFQTCRRAYYYNYYFSWSGWNRDADPARAKAYRLKKLTRLPMWAGEALHQALADWFGERSRGRTPGPEWVEERALNQLRRGYKQSRDEAAAWERRPARSIRLAEHYYGEPDVDESGDAAKRYGTRYVERIQAGVKMFFEDPQLAEAREADPASYLACEELGTIELFGQKVYAIPDFAWRAADGNPVILDWKTGKPREQDAFQLSLYALYAEQVWGADPLAVRSADVYLTDGEVHWLELDAEQLEATRTQVEESMGEMLDIHFNADQGVGNPDDFPLLPEEGPGARECARCSYRELCGRS